MSAKSKHLKRGFTLVELMIVVAIVGILAALAVYGVSRYVRNAKTAEARDALGRMGKDAVAAYQRETMSGAVLELGERTDAIHALCPSADPVPQDMPHGQKYQSKPSEWTGGWKCLRFSMNEPQYYQYAYTVTGELHAENTTFECRARGDLDGDQEADSVLTLGGAIKVEGGEKVAILAPTLTESDSDESSSGDGSGDGEGEGTGDGG